MPIDINTAGVNELKKLRGVGDKTAEKIVRFRDEGGRFQDLTEFQNVSGLRTDYLEDIRDQVSVGEWGGGGAVVGSGSGLGDLLPDIAVPELPVLPSFRLKSFRFDVTLRSDDGRATEGENLFAGHKLVVGYRIAQFHTPTPLVRPKRQSASYEIGRDGHVDVRIDRPSPSFHLANNSFELAVTGPDGSTVFDTTREIEEGGSVALTVPRFRDNSFTVKLIKPELVSYAGYLLRVDYRLVRAGGSVESRRKEFDIAARDEVLVTPDPYGEVREVDIRVLSANGMVVTRQTGLPDGDGQPTVELTLEEPESISYEAVLDVAPGEANPYADHTLTVTYTLRDPDADGRARKVENAYMIGSDGRSDIGFEYHGSIERMEATVTAPSGAVIGNRSFRPEEVRDGEIEIHVPAQKLAAIDGVEMLPERPQKTAGRVIDGMGRRNYEGVQIIIYAANVSDDDDDDEEETPFRPLLVTETESNGYFTIDTPEGYFREAYARVGADAPRDTDPGPEDVPIRLEPDTVVEYADGQRKARTELFFPPNVILVLGQSRDPDTDDEDECGDLRLQPSKKVVDEFSFHSVVRTTEPEIQGVTLDPDDDTEDEDEEVPVMTLVEDLMTEKAVDLPSSSLRKGIRKSVLRKYFDPQRGLTGHGLRAALRESNARKLGESMGPVVRAKGRSSLDWDNRIDWDEDPTIYQAVSIAHGHLLQFKQEWINDGYSLGDLLYSLPLAPGQKKRIVTFDWERKESASRSGIRSYQESLYNSLSRDRDINEIATGALDEYKHGRSEAKSSSISAGLGAGAGGKSGGGFLGVAGGASKSTAEAWQNSSRDTSMTNFQQIHDRTVQSANSVRSQRSTVVAQASQGERFSTETEVVANYNHCHSLTIQYFEVLRHLRIRQRLAAVRECLFVPLIMEPFEHRKILRWREALEPYIFEDKLERGFDSIERIENDWEGSDLPEERYADENIEYLEGDFYIRFNIAPPHDLSSLEEEDKVRDALNAIGLLLPHLSHRLEEIAKAEAERRNDLFFENVAPEIAAAFVQNLEFEAVLESGPNSSRRSQPLNLDTTLVSGFQNNTTHYVSVRQAGTLSAYARADIRAIAIRKASLVLLDTEDGLQSLASLIPKGTSILVESATMRYRTQHFSGELFRDSRVDDDLFSYGRTSGTENVWIPAPLSREEMRNPRDKDIELAQELVRHLNDNLEEYHRRIWLGMSDERRFMLLDGIRVTDYSDTENYPDGVVRSVASVVENRIIGIVGNSLVMPVAPGFRLDPNVKGQDIDLLSLYRPPTAPSPTRIAIPTRGVYAEAVMGRCNACEKIEEDRFWRWSEEPIPMSPTRVQPVGTQSRRAEPLDTEPQRLPEPVVNVQNAPQAPDPQGMGGLANLLGTSSFQDITGLSQTQKNALQALQSSMGTAQSFGMKAAELAATGQKLNAIDKARKSNLLSEEKAQEMAEKSIEASNSAEAGSLRSGLDGISKVGEMVKKGELSEAQGKQLTDSITKGMSNQMSNGVGGLNESVETTSRQMREQELGSVEWEKQGQDGSKTSFKASGKTRLAQASTGGSPTGTLDPAYRPMADRALKQKAREWSEERTYIHNTGSSRAVNTAEDEYLAWADNPQSPDQSRLKEDEAEPGSGHARQSDLFDRLRAYAAAADPDRTNARNVQQAEQFSTDDEPWSAAFISYAMSQAGFGPKDGFEVSGGHSRYVLEALVNRLNRDYGRPFWLFRLDEVAVRTGDIICKARGGATMDFDQVMMDLVGDNENIPRVIFENGNWRWGQSWFESHADIVHDLVEEDGSQYAYTIGGNTEHLTGDADTVGKKKYRLDASGMVREEVYDALHENVTNGSASAGDTHENSSPWAVLKMLDGEWFETWRKTFEKFVDEHDEALFYRDSFLEVFGTPDENGELQLRPTIREALEGDAGQQIFPGAEGSVLDVDRKVLFKPMFRTLPPNVA